MDNCKLGQRLATLPSEFRVKEEDIDKLIAESTQQRQVFWGKEMVISFSLASGFTVTGRSACIDPANFDEEIGVYLCENDAKSQLWQLEGYRKQCIWAEEGKNFKIESK